MDEAFHRQWLTRKFEEIGRRLTNAITQLDDEQVNWRPNDASLSIATLVRHIAGNVQERVASGMLGRERAARNRDEELQHRETGRDELLRLIETSFALVLETLRGLTNEALLETQEVRGRERTNLDMLHQCAAHYSEHMGQIFYIAKQQLGERYRSTSI